MNVKPKSRVSIRNLFRIETGKKIILGLLVCAVVFGAYVGVHRLTSKAGDETLTGPKITRDGTKRGVLTSIDDIKGKDKSKDLGTPDNPFVILEILPWTGRAMMGYQIEGCEPLDYRKLVRDAKTEEFKNKYGSNQSYEGFFTTYTDLQFTKGCFKDEKSKNIPESWTKNESEFYHNGETTLVGFYEKLDPDDDYDGQRFKIADKYNKVDNNKYAPVFEKDSNGDFMWVSYGDQNLYYNTTIKLNKYAVDSDGNIKVYNEENDNYDLKKLSFKAGDRFYTLRKDKEYYSGGDDPIDKMWVPGNIFLRESLGAYSRKKAENYCVFIKTIEPSELNEYSEWIDYADLIYMHHDMNMASARELWIKYPDYRKAKEPDYNKYPRTDYTTKFGYSNDGNEYWKTHQNDITWPVALKMFYRVNGLGEYAGENDNANGSNMYAPLIMDHEVMNSVEENNYATKYDIKTRNIDYTTMKCVGANVYNTGSNNNIYKFLLMNIFMDPDNFYYLFLTPCECNDNKPVIQEIDGQGACTIQENDPAKIFWSKQTFRAYDSSDVNKYAANIDNGSAGYVYAHDRNIFANTYIFRSGNQMNKDISQKDYNLGSPGFKDAINWFNEDGDVKSGIDPKKDSLNSIDIVYYMLNYKKGGSPGGIVRRPNSFNVLDIEPCKDYSTLTNQMVKLLFPPSKYKSNINIDRMTVAEFNSSRINLSKDYDVVYIGTDTGKLNTDSGGTKYNDTSLNGNVYNHVGDKFSSASSNVTYRTSGNDFTTPSLEKLKSFARAGNIVLLPDVFYIKSSKFNQDKYNKLLDSADKSNLNVKTFLDYVNKDLGGANNITSISEQLKANAALNDSDKDKRDKVLANFTRYTNVDFVVEWDKDGKEKEVTISNDSAGKYYMDFSFVVGRDVAYDEAVEKAEKEAKKEANGDENKRKEILKNKLKNIKQTKYKVKLLIDKNGDGIFTDDESGSEIVKIYPSPDDTKGPSSDGTYSTSTMKNSQYVPYKVRYDLPANYNKGNIAWKFVIYNADSNKKDAYIERTGVSVYNGRNKATKVNALQIVSDKELDNAKGNLEKQLKDASSKYKKYIDDAKGYEIKVETVSVSQYRDMFKDKDQKFVVDGDAHYYSSDLDEYNLVIVSCGDDLSKDITKDDINSTGNIKYSALAYLAYLDIADEGVIYTSNTVNGSNTAGQKVIKDAFNLSRFTSAGVNNSMYTDQTKYYKKTTGDYEGDSTELERTYYSVMKDFSSSDSHYVYKDSIWKNIQPEGKKLDTQKASIVDRNNTGAITSYPYKIDSNISIKGTEAQHYQLNLNNPYAMVWYSLADKEKQKETYKEKDEKTGKEVIKEREKLVDTDKAYGISPRDGANNYYLYNTGNIFYTGIDLAADNGDEEIKLFVNTLVAASGSTSKYPSVTIDEIINDEKEGACEPNLQKVVDKNTKKEYQFNALANSAKALDAYKEYRPDATSEPTATVTPGAVSTPKPTVKPTEKPITDPAAKPDNTADGKRVAILYNNKFASSDGYYDCADADWMTNLPNDAVLQVQYTSGETVPKDNKSVKIEVTGNGGAKGTIILKACENPDSESEDIQKVNVSVSTLKNSLGSAGSSISGITVRPFGWNNSTVVLSVKLIGSKYRGNYTIGNTVNVTGNSKEKLVKSINKHTHLIKFTSYDGNLDFAPVEKVSIAITDGMYGSETIAKPVEVVYRDEGDDKYMTDSTLGDKDSANAGKFIKSNGTYMMSGVQYYIAYDKAYAKGGTPYLRFTIENGKHKSVTYVQVVDKSEPPKEDVYMFDLD